MSAPSFPARPNVHTTTCSQFETQYFADSVEACPFELVAQNIEVEYISNNYIVCGNYELIESEQKKIGKCYLMNIDR
jgi:hypothetical protein